MPALRDRSPRRQHPEQVNIQIVQGQGQERQQGLEKDQRIEELEEMLAQLKKEKEEEKNMLHAAGARVIAGAATATQELQQKAVISIVLRAHIHNRNQLYPSKRRHAVTYPSSSMVSKTC